VFVGIRNTRQLKERGRAILPHTRIYPEQLKLFVLVISVLALSALLFPALPFLALALLALSAFARIALFSALLPRFALSALIALPSLPFLGISRACSQTTISFGAPTNQQECHSQ
jgi:hypothetical protein